MKGAKTRVISTRATTLFDRVCDSPAAQRSEQTGVKIFHAVHNHWPRLASPPWPITEWANNKASSAGAKNSNNKIVPRHASDTLNPSVLATCRSHSFSLQAAGLPETASAACRGTGVATGNARDKLVAARNPKAASRGTILPPSQAGHRI
ncbi:MAG: hypothetical protein DME18_15240 [Verrucomicrobia bacterium]|nr:MAG: hypothetical protein DME18_15240 [Verrucomicrobiota bacterium]